MIGTSTFNLHTQLELSGPSPALIIDFFRKVAKLGSTVSYPIVSYLIECTICECLVRQRYWLTGLSQSRVVLRPWFRDHVTYLAVHSAFGRVMRQSVSVAASRTDVVV